MFSSGQWTFVIFFVITFVIVITLSYKKDKLLHKKTLSRFLLGFNRLYFFCNALNSFKKLSKTIKKLFAEQRVFFCKLIFSKTN